MIDQSEKFFQTNYINGKNELRVLIDNSKMSIPIAYATLLNCISPAVYSISFLKEDQENEKWYEEQKKKLMNFQDKKEDKLQNKLDKIEQNGEKEKTDTSNYEGLTPQEEEKAEKVEEKILKLINKKDAKCYVWDDKVMVIFPLDDNSQNEYSNCLKAFVSQTNVSADVESKKFFGKLNNAYDIPKGADVIVSKDDKKIINYYIIIDHKIYSDNVLKDIIEKTKNYTTDFHNALKKDFGDKINVFFGNNSNNVQEEHNKLKNIKQIVKNILNVDCKISVSSDAENKIFIYFSNEALINVREKALDTIEDYIKSGKLKSMDDVNKLSFDYYNQKDFFENCDKPDGVIKLANGKDKFFITLNKDKYSDELLQKTLNIYKKYVTDMSNAFKKDFGNQTNTNESYKIGNNMKLDEAKQILKNNGYLLSERDMDDIDYAEMYEPMVADEFEKIILKIKKNLNKELPGTEIDTNTFEVKYEGFFDLNSAAKVSCSISFLLPKEETEYLDNIEDTEYEKEYERIWNIAKTDIEEINDNWYYDADWKDGRDLLKIETTCNVEGDEIIW